MKQLFSDIKQQACRTVNSRRETDEVSVMNTPTFCLEAIHGLQVQGGKPRGPAEVRRWSAELRKWKWLEVAG